MKRTLSLSREALAELTADDLGAVVGGQEIGPTGGGDTCPLIECLNSRRIPCTV